jgi:phospholipase/carboxylesterase
MRVTKQARKLREFSDGRLSALPHQVKATGSSGLQQLKLGGRRDGFVFVPDNVGSERPAPLLLMLHGAGGSARHSINWLQGYAERFGLILLVPDSREGTWDVITGGYGADVAYINRALEQTFGRYNVDPTHLAVGGFSDGASYALSLGLTNGDLFTHIIAFSPGFIAPAGERGTPALFISHGTRDDVLPIQVCSRRIVPEVKRAGYNVQYREFDGPHTVPDEIALEAMDWFLKGGRAEG